MEETDVRPKNECTVRTMEQHYERATCLYVCLTNPEAYTKSDAVYLLYSSIFLFIISSKLPNTLVKVDLSKARTFSEPEALTVACLGFVVNKAISPK